jgi:hypothetical protein
MLGILSVTYVLPDKAAWASKGGTLARTCCSVHMLRYWVRSQCREALLRQIIPSLCLQTTLHNGSCARCQRVSQPDEYGRFSIPDVPAGRYYAIALEYTSRFETAAKP